MAGLKSARAPGSLALIFASFVEKLGLMVGIFVTFVVHAMEFNSCLIF